MAEKTAADYTSLGENRGFRWIAAEIPRDTKVPTDWQCSVCGHVWRATYGNICHQESGCPKCVDVVNGHRVSKQQRAICELVDGELNVSCGRFAIDVAVERGRTPVAIEYDSWYWHGPKQCEDHERDQAIVSAGWKVLRVRSNSALPTTDQINEALNDLVIGDHDIIEIRLPDWGTGPVCDEIHLRKRFGTSEHSVTEKSTGSMALPLRPSECVGELAGRWLYFRSGEVDIDRLVLTPSEAALLNFVLESNLDAAVSTLAKVLVFTDDAVGKALGRPDSTYREAAMLSRLRRRVQFTIGCPVGLLTGRTRGQYRTTIPIRRRPSSRIGATIQTSYSEWRSFEDARKFVHTLGLRSQLAWHQWVKTPFRPNDIPTNPNRVYRERGWVSWADWLGKSRDLHNRKAVAGTKGVAK